MELTAKYLNKYSIMWNRMEIKPDWKSRVFRTAKMIYSNKDKYQEISEAAGGSIPWKFIGIVHNLETGLNFNKHLHNGDPLSARTKLVPAGRPAQGLPPFTFTESAIDALRLKNLHKLKEEEWTISRVGYELERYNGWGYANKGLPSPYLWSGSNNYTKGKFVRDHVYDEDEVSAQVGGMCLWKALLELEKTEEKSKPITDYKEASSKSRRLTITNYIVNFLRGLTLPFTLSLSFLQEVKEFVSDNAGLAIVIFLGLGWLAMEAIQYFSKGEVKEGRYKTKEEE